jgi:transposase-like protein
MARQRKTYSAAFKARIALAALKGDSTANVPVHGLDLP